MQAFANNVVVTPKISGIKGDPLERQNMNKRIKIAAAVASAAVAVAGFGAIAPASAAAPVEITVWAMQGQPGEVTAAQQEVAAFNAAGLGVHATLSFKDNMGGTLSSTNVGDLADAFEFDGETLANLVYNGKLAQLDGLVAKSTFANELSSIKAEGTYSDGHSYSVSQFDSGLTLWGNKTMLKAAGITAPTTWQKAWTAAEFTNVLKKLAAKAPGGKAIDFKENYGIGGGWAGYAFTAITNGVGNHLVHYSKGVANKASGYMNTSKVASALKTFVSWKKYSDPSSDDKAFTDGRVALAWVGHWAAPGIFSSLGRKNVQLIPLPNFGQGTKSGQGSHSWAIGAGSKHKVAAAKFLQFITSDKWILNLTKQNGAVPATKTALNKNADYKKGGILYLYRSQLEASCGIKAPTTKCVTVPRTITAAWPTINSAYSKAIGDAWDGTDPQTALNTAALTIDQNLSDNNYYIN